VWSAFNKDSLEYKWKKPAFYHFDNINDTSGLIAVRGTYVFSDVLQDISLYSEVAILQSVSYVIPLTAILPIGFLRDWVWVAGKTSDGLIDPSIRDQFDKPVLEFLRDKFEANPNRSVLIAGHSLGGAIAQIVAAKIADKYKTDKVYSFGLSSPGTVFTSEKFGFSIEALDKTSLSVLPRRDPVAMGDQHGGAWQLIECDATQSLGCHSSDRSFCELYHNCGSESARNKTFADCLCNTDDGTWAGCMGFVDGED
jgi:hypothetical protein